MVEPLTAAVVISLFFSEAVKEGGKVLGKGFADSFALLVDTVREKLRAEGTEGLLIRAQNQPIEANKAKLQEELQSQMDVDEEFAHQLKEIVEQLQARDKRVRQVVLSEIELSGSLKTQDISQKARGGTVEQEMLKGIKAQNIDVGNIKQEAQSNGYPARPYANCPENL